MYRLRYIFEFKDVVDEVRKLRIPKHIQLEVMKHANRNFDKRQWAIAAIRGFLSHELYLNLLPDNSLPYVHRDSWDLASELPHLVKRVHRQIDLPLNLLTEWVRIEFNEENDLSLEFDFRPFDFSVYGVSHASHFSPPRNRM